MVTITKKHGFTLVEMLVSMVILSSVIVISTQAYRQFVVNAEQFSNKYQQVLLSVQKRELVFERIEQTILYIANNRNLFGDSELSIYWQGYEDKLLSVTRMSLQEPDKAAVFKLYLDENDLVYCEKIIQGWLPQIGKEPDGLCDFSLVISDNVKSIKFSYFGWEDAFKKMTAVNAKFFSDFNYKKEWFNRYDSIKSDLLPEWILLDITYKSGDVKKDKWMFPIKHQDPLRYRLLNSRSDI